MSALLEALGVVEAVREDESDGSTEPRARTLAWGTALAGLCVCLAFQPWSVAIQGLDSMFYYFTAERVAYGTPPHLSAFSPQNALGVVLPGLGILAGRLFGLDAVYSSRAVTILLYSVSIAGVALLGFRLFSRWSGGVFAALVYLTFTPLAFMATATGQPKTVLAVFVPLALYGVVREKPFLAGLAAAGAYLSYQPALLIMAGIGVAFLCAPGWKGNLGRALIGFALPVAAYCLYLGLTGALTEAFIQTHLFMAISRGEEQAPGATTLLHEWRRIWVGGFGARNVIPVIGIAGLAGLVLAVVIRARAAWGAARREPGWIAVLVSGLGVFAYAWVDYGGVPDTFLGLTFLALFTTVALMAMVAFIRRRLGDRAGRGVQVVVVLGLLSVALGGFDQQRRNTLPYGLAEQREAAAAVGQMLEGGSRVFVLGYPYLLSMNHVDNWSIFSSSHSVRPGSGYWQYRHPGEDFIPRRGDSLPDVIVWSRGKPPGWPGWLKQNFDSVEVAPLTLVGASVWRRRQQ